MKQPCCLGNNDPSPSPRSVSPVASGTQCNLILFTTGTDAGMGKEHRPQPISTCIPQPQGSGGTGAHDLSWSNQSEVHKFCWMVERRETLPFWTSGEQHCTRNCCRHFATRKGSQRTKPTHEGGQSQERDREMEQES